MVWLQMAPQVEFQIAENKQNNNSMHTEIICWNILEIILCEHTIIT